jgi:hypothetical protein
VIQGAGPEFKPQYHKKKKKKKQVVFEYPPKTRPCYSPKLQCPGAAMAGLKA